MTKLLLVDDDTLLIKVYSTVLSSSGYEVDTAADGLEAYEKLRANQYAIVVSDIMLPKMTGFDLLEKMKSDPKLAAIPVISMTNLTTDHICETAMAKGASWCCIKDSLTPKDLLQVVADILTGKKPTIQSVPLR